MFRVINVLVNTVEAVQVAFPSYNWSDIYNISFPLYLPRIPPCFSPSECQVHEIKLRVKIKKQWLQILVALKSALLNTVSLL